MMQGRIRFQVLVHNTWEDLMTLPAGNDAEITFYLQDLKRQYPDHRVRAVTARGQLLDSVWGQDSDIELRTVDVHIRRLRKAINLPGTADIIRTVRSAGYALDAGKG